VTASSQRVVVTGGAGFIGSELVRQLAETGARVTVLDNLVNGRRENVAGLNNVRLEAGDIRDAARVTEVLREADTVYHLACLGVRHSIHSPVENHEVNANATLQLLMLARAAKVRRFVCVSSSEVYGTARIVPMTEQHPTFPHTVYGASKLAGECYARAFHDTYGLGTVIVRPFNSYGPRSHHDGDSGEVIPKFLLRSLAGRPMVVFGDGTQTRDFTYVSDTARGILLGGSSDKAVGKTINLGSGKEVSINDLAREVARVAERPDAAIERDAPRPGDVLRLYCDSRLARELLGFAPTVGLRDGITRLKEWYLALGQPIETLLENETVRNWEGVNARA